MESAISPTEVKVLVAHPDDFRMEMIRFALEGTGFWNYVEVNDGVRALTALERWLPDVAVAAPEMPGVNGLVLTHCIRTSSKSRYRRLPIILVSDPVSRGYAELAVHLGIDDLLIFPFSANELKRRILRALEEQVVAYLEDQVVGAPPVIPERRAVPFSAALTYERAARQQTAQSRFLNMLDSDAVEQTSRHRGDDKSGRSDMSETSLLTPEEIEFLRGN